MRVNFFYPEKIKRNAALDNAKLILVFLVVLGHFIEPVLNAKTPPWFLNLLYGWIYLFHMPAFVIVSGYLAAKSTSVEFKRSILVPLLSFSVLYEFLNYILFGAVSHYMAMFMPYWLLWYLFSLYIWRKLIVRYEEPALLLRIGLCVSLLFGFLGSLGNLFGLARTVYFFPFFVFGYAVSMGVFPRLSLRPSLRWFCVFITLSVGVCAFYYYVLHRFLMGACSPETSYYEYCFARFVSLLYGTKGYWHLESGAFVGLLLRVAIYICSFLLAYSFLRSVMSKTFFFTGWGHNTLYVFLWHGMLVKLVLSLDVFPSLLDLGGVFTLGVMLFISAAVTWLLSKHKVASYTEKYIFAPVANAIGAIWYRFILIKG